MKSPKIALCLIVKDDTELEKLTNCVDSIKSSISDVFVTSTSDKVSGIRNYCLKNKYFYSHFSWCKDFSAARNFNFSEATNHAEYDYLFWLDADDVVIGGENLSSIAKEALERGKDQVFFTYWYACTFDEEGRVKTVDMQQNRERLLKPGVTTWKGRLHETPVPVQGKELNYTLYSYNESERPFVVVHTNQEWSQKTDRNREILELQLSEERKSKDGADARTLLYLMKIYAEQESQDNLGDVITMGKEYLDKSGWDEERGTAWEQMGVAYSRMGDLKAAIKCFHQSLEEFPSQVLIYLRLANAYYNAGKYREAQHWLDVGMKLDVNDKNSSMSNVLAMKEMSTSLMVKLNFNVYKDYQKAFDSARLLYSILPTESNKNNVMFLEDTLELDKACKNVDGLLTYLDNIDQLKGSEILDHLPSAITKQPFAIKWRNKLSKPRTWGEKEICYFANFGGDHFEKWDANSMKKGIGGSETAVIRLSQEWTKKGYKVTVYGDPTEAKELDGVTYLPWYYFNKDDNFNILIQWRGWGLAGKVKAKKLFIDLHDIWNPVGVTNQHLMYIDKFMVKSKYHRDLAPNIPDEKFVTVSNGI